MAEVFAGYISYADDQLGRLIDFLDSSGQLDNTIVVVISDNGASGRGRTQRVVQRMALLQRVPDTTEETLPHIDELGGPPSYNHYNTGWAWALDTPFPYWKRWAGYEGGVSDMCLVSWPAKIPAQKQVRSQYIHAVDVVPTVYELLGITPPAVLKGYTQSPIEGESFAASLTDPDSPGKSTQFYTMLGQRSIYHEGWLACTVHPPLSGWGKFETDVWELYDIEHDRSQSNNLAEKEPVRLQAMKDLWFYNAGIYHGLPLDDRSAIEQVTAVRPRGAPDRDHYIYYPDCASVPEQSGVLIGGRSYTIAGSVTTDTAAAEGVIYAHGGIAGGHSLYVKDRRLHYAFNWVGTYLQEVHGDCDIEPGAHVLTAEFTATGRSADPKMPGAQGELVLYVDDQKVGAGEIVTQPGYFCAVGDGITVGRDDASPVTPGYQGPFAFTGGIIDKVVVDVSGGAVRRPRGTGPRVADPGLKGSIAAHAVGCGGERGRAPLRDMTHAVRSAVRARLRGQRAAGW